MKLSAITWMYTAETPTTISYSELLLLVRSSGTKLTVMILLNKLMMMATSLVSIGKISLMP